MNTNKSKVWIYLAENQGVCKADLFENHIIFSEPSNRFLFNKFLEIEIIYLDEEQKVYIQKQLDSEKYIRAILLGLNQLFLEKYVTISPEEKKKVDELLLTGKFVKEEKEKRIAQERQKEKQRLEKLKGQSWLLIINDVNDLEKRKKNIENYKSSPVYEVIKRLKDALKSKLYERIKLISQK